MAQKQGHPPQVSADESAIIAQQRSLAFEAVSMGWWNFDVESGRVEIDDRMKEMFGVTDHAWSYEGVISRVLHPDDREMINQSVQAALDPKNPKPYSVEYRAVRPDGTMRWISSRGKVTFVGEGAARRAQTFSGIAMDITEARQVRDDLQRSEGRFRFFTALVDATRALSDPVEVIETVARMFGQYLKADWCAYADVEEDGDHFTIHRDYTNGVPSIQGHYALEAFGHETAESLRAGKTFVMNDREKEMSEADKPAFRGLGVQATICCALIKNGRLAAMMAVHRREPHEWTAEEIRTTESVVERCWSYIERAKALLDLAQSEQRFRELADAMPQIVFMAQPDGHVDYFNRKWYEYTGLPEGGVGFESWKDTHEEDRLEVINERWQRATSTGEPYEIEYRLRRADGEWRWHLGRALPVRNAAGAIIRWFGTNTDIHDKKLLEEQNGRLLESERAARLEAERQGRMKDEFLATLSHELRTPLNAILGWSDVLARETSGATLSQGLEIIRRNARSQAQIIEDLLDLSRIVSGKVRLDVQRVDLAVVLNEAVETVRAGADAKGLRLQTVIDPRAGQVTGDPNRLQQVFWNLLTNAIKFTPKGGRVQVTLECVNSHLEISVMDTGVGIRADFLPLVFNRFQQADSSTTREFGGLGIGLAIVKQLVELHGGNVRAKSPGENLGATFIVSLPRTILHGADEHTERCHPRTSQAIAVRPPASLKGVRILVVDDERDARELVQRLLEDHEATVRTAGTAGEAFEKMAEALPDVLVSDIGMPGEDGYSLIRRLRALPAEQGGRIPALALTAYARSEDRMMAVQAGFQMHIAKPVEPLELLTMVASLADRVGHA